MELLCAKGGEQRETQANELLFMIFFWATAIRDKAEMSWMYVISFLDGVFSGVVFFPESKAREQQSRKDAAISSNSKFDSFFLGCPNSFWCFFFAFTSLLYFSSLACSRLWISFSYNEMVFQKNTKTGIFKFLTCQKPHTLSSYPIIASKNDKHVRPYLSELTITHFHPTSTFGKRKGQKTRLYSPGSLSLLLIAARNTKSGPKSVG